MASSTLQWLVVAARFSLPSSPCCSHVPSPICLAYVHLISPPFAFLCLSLFPPPPLPPPPPLTRPTSTLVVIVIPAPRFHLDLFLRQPLCCTCCFLARLPPAFFSLFPPPFAFLSLRSALLRAPCLMCCSGETT